MWCTLTSLSLMMKADLGDTDGLLRVGAQKTLWQWDQQASLQRATVLMDSQEEWGQEEPAILPH